MNNNQEKKCECICHPAMNQKLGTVLAECVHCKPIVNQPKETWQEQFDKKFVDKIQNIDGDFAYEEMKYGEQQDVQELRDFISQEIDNAKEEGFDKGYETASGERHWE